MSYYQVLCIAFGKGKRKQALTKKGEGAARSRSFILENNIIEMLKSEEASGKKEKNIYRGGDDLNATCYWKDLYTLYYLLYMKSQFLFVHNQIFPCCVFNTFHFTCSTGNANSSLRCFIISLELTTCGF